MSLNRRKGLSSSAEQVRRWQARSRERALERQRETKERQARGAPARTGKKKAKIPPAIRREVLARSAGVCVVCLHEAGIDDPERLTDAALRKLIRDDVLARAVQVHHVLPEADYEHLAKLAENLIGVCSDCHYSHEFGGVNRRRVPLAVLPAATLALAEREGLMWYIDRTYPA